VGIVASFGRLDAKAMAAAIEVGADAVEVQVSGASDIDALAGLSERLGVPIGIAAASGFDAGLAKAAQYAQADWLRLSLQDSMRAVGWERPARILTIPSDLDLRIVSAVNGLEIDAVQIDAMPRTDTETTLGEGLRLKSLRELLRKPFLVHVSVGLTPDLAPAYEQLGIDALVVPAGRAQSQDLVAAYVAALQSVEPAARA
jgi:thiazole synthase ThiGH ThiG subunit